MGKNVNCERKEQRAHMAGYGMVGGTMVAMVQNSTIPWYREDKNQHYHT